MNQRKKPMAREGAGAVRHGYMSSAVEVDPGPLVFVSGQVSWDENHSVVGIDDGPAQARQVFTNLSRVLAEYDAGLDDIVKITLFVTSMDWFEELAAIREELFVGPGPASTIVQVSRLVQPELMIEVEAVAVVR